MGWTVAKRCFDLAVTIPCLVLLSPLMALIALAIRCDSCGPSVFRQRRMGRGFRPFEIYKFRTMVNGAAQKGPFLTPHNDSRVTRLGRFLRKTKLDELPQLINVLKGDMSLVGPRPEVERYVEMFRADYEQILSVRPGITDPASLAYRAEAELLARAPNPEDFYLRHILPDKIVRSKQYLARSSVLVDLGILLKTLGALGETLVSAWRRPSPTSPLEGTTPPYQKGEQSPARH